MRWIGSASIGSSLTGAPGGVTPGLSSSSLVVLRRKPSRSPAATPGRISRPSACSGGGAAKYWAASRWRGQIVKLVAETEAAGYALLLLDIDGVDVGTGGEADAVLQVAVVEGRHDLDKRGGRDRRQIVGQQLIEQGRGEFGELALDLELDARRHERGAFQKPGNAGVHLVLDQPAKAARHAGIFLGELARLLVELLQLQLIEIEEIAVHARLLYVGSRVRFTLPELISSSATKLSAMSTGMQNISHETVNCTRWSTSLVFTSLSTWMDSEMIRGS